MRRCGDAAPPIEAEASEIKLDGLGRKFFTFGYLGFLRSFQGPLGQTHNHKPQNGVRGRVKGVN
jgi:hypothetical protein